MTYTISQLAKAFGLSRSTLLYYEKVGVLVASQRSQANYRYYSEGDFQRLKRITLYKDTGMSLEQIIEVLDKQPQNDLKSTLEDQLDALNKEIERLRQQQKHTVDLLISEGINHPAGFMDKAQWVSILRSTGMNEAQMWRWHQEFEQRSPQMHQAFLVSLNISAEEIEVIRRRSISDAEKST